MARPAKLVTVYCEAVLEPLVIRELDRLGVVGYTVSDCRGRGQRGERGGQWRMSANVRIEVVCDPVTSERIAAALRPYEPDYGLLVVRGDVEVLN
ncbi:hypothetical protein Tsedi_00711 [Tepidimonas sediminis]|uniref:Membrane-associated protein n=1 Tax=Tepidimonas sediminis TaxID=2588941 RepID=A0A554WS84_9BURK|nr:transcriptional regulator [Tepidimonas sediminis]TSE26413.1 hypothetical protein Tsedi_00711 [Tepidimonas sediminis]